jgi:hypothetical protein
MKMKRISFLTAFLMMFLLTGCQAIGDIFSAGMYTGFFIVLLVVAIVIFIISKLGNRGK